ncbi:MAG: hypothetical protein QOI83_1731, partial [Streptomycetaceae bacterium]|nr:hypothetical protein [Streptomycetaceae bacterium]
FQVFMQGVYTGIYYRYNNRLAF